MTDNTPTDWQSRQPTGLLARIAHTQTSHPKRTVFGGLFLFILICFLAFGPLKGTLENKFVIPGSDAQKATDVLKSKFDARNGAILQVVFAADSGKLDDANTLLTAWMSLKIRVSAVLSVAASIAEK